MDLSAMSIEKSWTVAPLTDGNFGSCDKHRRPAHRFETQHLPIVADHSMQPNRAFNALLHGFRRIRRIDAFQQPTGLYFLWRLCFRVDAGRHRDRTARADRD